MRGLVPTQISLMILAAIAVVGVNSKEFFDTRSWWDNFQQPSFNDWKSFNMDNLRRAVGPADHLSAQSRSSRDSSDGYGLAPNNDGYFQYINVPAHKEYEFGWNRGNPNHFISRYEQNKDHRFRTRVKWSDAYGGYGENYYEYNHGPTYTEYNHGPTYTEHNTYETYQQPDTYNSPQPTYSLGSDSYIAGSQPSSYKTASLDVYPSGSQASSYAASSPDAYPASPSFGDVTLSTSEQNQQVPDSVYTSSNAQERYLRKDEVPARDFQETSQAHRNAVE